jgi:hypothetical protein
MMRQQASPGSIASFWRARLPDQIPDRLVIAEELRGNVVDFEGHDLVAVEEPENRSTTQKNPISLTYSARSGWGQTLSADLGDAPIR